MEKLWTTLEVARCLGISELDVEGLVRQGKLTGYKLGGQFLRFRPDQVEALRGQVKPGSGAFPPPARRRTWSDSLRDFLYFYDFYLISATFLAALIVYLIAAE